MQFDRGIPVIYRPPTPARVSAPQPPSKPANQTPSEIGRGFEALYHVPRSTPIAATEQAHRPRRSLPNPSFPATRDDSRPPPPNYLP